MSRNSQKNKPVGRLETITPDRARRLLETNEMNRNLSVRHVEFLSSQMSDKEWRVTGEPIIMDTDGKMLNGQHRCAACIMAGVPFDTMVIRNVDTAAFSFMDTGRTRTAGDVAHIAGYRHARKMAAAARMAMQIEAMSPGGAMGSIRGYRRPHEHTLKYIEKHEALLTEGIELVYNTDGRHILKPPSSFTGLYKVLAEGSHVRARTFYEKLAAGESLEANDPVFRLRQRLIREVAQAHLRRPHGFTIVLAIHAWNAWMRGDKRVKLQVRETDGWPKIVLRKSSEPIRRSRG